MELKPIFSDDSDHLEHYGVPGMKWGVRKARPTSGKRYNKAAEKKKAVRYAKKALVTGVAAAAMGPNYARMLDNSMEKYGHYDKKPSSSKKKTSVKKNLRPAQLRAKQAGRQLALLYSRKLRKAAKSSSLDAENLKKAGYLEEARAVKKVSDKQMAKAKAIEAKRYNKAAERQKAVRYAKKALVTGVAAAAMGPSYARMLDNSMEKYGHYDKK